MGSPQGRAIVISDDSRRSIDGASQLIDGHAVLAPLLGLQLILKRAEVPDALALLLHQLPSHAGAGFTGIFP